MRHLALFNGIGGFQLAADWCGWENVAHCEIDDFCNKVVARHFPHSKCYKDIKKFTGSEYRGTIDIYFVPLYFYYTIFDLTHFIFSR